MCLSASPRMSHLPWMMLFRITELDNMRSRKRCSPVASSSPQTLSSEGKSAPDVSRVEGL